MTLNITKKLIGLFCAGYVTSYALVSFDPTKKEMYYDGMIEIIWRIEALLITPVMSIFIFYTKIKDE